MISDENPKRERSQLHLFGLAVALGLPPEVAADVARRAHDGQSLAVLARDWISRHVDAWRGEP